MKKLDLRDVVAEAPNRRSMLRKLGAASAAVTAAAAGGGLKVMGDPATPSPENIVQFALNLEYLDSELYSIATTGKSLEDRGLDLSGAGTPGPTITKYGAVNFSNNLLFTRQVALDLAADEAGHVQVLRSALLSNGVTPIAKPTINLDALEAKGASLANEASFLLLAKIFEEVGISAYAGGAQYLSNSPYLTTAARITATEAEHAANLRLQIARLAIPSPPLLDGADVSSSPQRQQFLQYQPAEWVAPVSYSGAGSLLGVRQSSER